MGIGAAGQAFTYNKGGMLPDDVIAFKFAVPASTTNTVPPTFASQGTISIAEYSGGPVQRTGTISTKACDFRGFVAGGPYPIDATGTNFPIKWNFGQSVNFNWLVSGTVAGAVTLTPGATYYVNVRNLNPDSGTGTCTLSTCDIIGSVSAPK
jgi:hypothetical protein